MRLLLFMLLLIAVRLNGQDDYLTRLYAREDSLHQLCKCTLISFAVPEYPKLYPDSIPGLGDYYIIAQLYIFFKIEKRHYVQKSMTYFRSGMDSATEAQSQVIDISGDSILEYIINSVDRLSREEIRPYVFRQIDKKTNLSTYNIWEPLAPPKYQLRVVSTQLDYTNTVDSISIERSVPGFPKNLNYDFNRTTRTFEIIKALKSRLKRLDREFVLN